MERLFEIDQAPRSRKEIAAFLDTLERQTAARFEEFSDEEFHAPQGRHWSPAGHLRQLAKVDSAGDALRRCTGI